MAKRTESRRDGDRRRHPRAGAAGRPVEGQSKRRTAPVREQRPPRSAPRTTPPPPQPKRRARPVDSHPRPKSAAQAKARAKARKAKAPKVVRPPFRERILVRLAAVDLNPRRLVTRVPFVVLVIGALGIGLGVTLWLSTDAAERSYQLGHARETNRALMQQKEALERQVLEAQAAPALAESARELGMIPSRDTAHLIQDPSGAWVVVGTPKPAEGTQPPPLNTPLPDPPAARPAAGPPAPRVVDPREVAVHVPSRPAPGQNPEVAVAAPIPGQIPAPIPGQVPAVAPEVPAAVAPAPAPAPAPVDAAPPAPFVPLHGVPTPAGPVDPLLPVPEPGVGQPAVAGAPA